MSARVEPQISKDDKGYWLTVTISSGDNYWTSQPSFLGNGTKDEAMQEAFKQVSALRRILS